MTVAAGGAERRVPAAEGVPIMVLEIYQNYHLPLNPYDMTRREAEFWYRPLIPSLARIQAGRT